MRLDPDFKEFIECCIAREVRFLIVGGYAVAAHGHPRFTKDLDVWLWPGPGNAAQLVAALADFGFGSVGLSEADFAEPGTVVQLGYAPKRIDLLTSIDGVEFEDCFGSRLILGWTSSNCWPPSVRPWSASTSSPTCSSTSGRGETMAEVPEYWVDTAHARGLLTFFEVAKLLDLRSTDVLDLMRDGELEYERIGNKPCASLAALDAYRRRRRVA